MKNFMKKSVSVFMIVVMLFTMVPLQGFVGVDFSGWFASEAKAASVNSEQIAVFDIDDLKSISNNLDADYILMRNIDLSSENWTPIGNGSNPFTGTFDGNGYTIRNLTISGTYEGEALVGLFGNANGAKIFNLKVKDASIDISSLEATETFSCVGPVCGRVNNTTISKCSASGYIKCIAQKGHFVRVGGIVGETSKSSSITDCASSCDLVGEAKSHNCMVGGISAWLESSSAHRCLFSGSINAGTSSTYVYCGGISASGSGDIQNSAVLASKMNNTGNSVIYGSSVNGYVAYFNTYNNKVLEGISGNVSGMSGSNSYITSAQAVMQSTYSSMGWDFTNTWTMNEGYPELQCNGSIGTGVGSEFGTNSNLVITVYGSGNYTFGNEFIAEKSFNTRLKGVKAKVSGQTSDFEADKKGVIRIDKMKISGDITLVKNGYRDYVIPKEVYDSFNDTFDCNLSVTMVEDDGKQLFISSVYARENGIDRYENVCLESLTITSDKTYDFYISADIPSGAKMYIAQEGTFNQSSPQKIKVNNGYNYIAGDSFKSFRKDKKTYIICESNSGDTVQSIKLNFEEAADTNWFIKEAKEGRLAIGGDSGLSITLPEDWIIVGGSTFDLVSLKLPVGVDIQGNKVRMTIGLDLWNKTTTESTSKNMTDLNTGEKYDKSTAIKTETAGIIDDGMWATIKKGIDNEKDAWKNATEPLEKKQIQKKLCDKYGLSRSQLSSNNSKNTGISVDAIGYLEGKIINGRFEMLSLMISVSGKFIISYTAQLQAGYLGVEGSGKLEISFSKSRELADPQLKYGIDLLCTATPEITLRGGVGLDGVASLGTYGTARAPISIALSFSEKNTKLGIQFKGEVGYEGQILFWKTGRQVLVSGETEKFEEVWDWNPNKRLLLMNRSNLLIDEPIISAQLTTEIIDRPNTEQKWLGSNNTTLRNNIKMSNVVNMATFVNLQNDIYAKTNAKVITTKDATVAVWLSEDKSRDDYNWQKLVFSVYDKSTKTWSEPNSVYDDGYIDASPCLVSDGTNIYVAWQKFVKTFNAENSAYTSDILEAGEIYLAEFDKTSYSFKEVIRITNNSVYDYNPTVTVMNGVPHVHYSTSLNNRLLSVDGNTISMYVNGITTVLKNNISTVNAIASTVVNDGVEVTYSVDADGNLNTTEDISLFSGIDSFERVKKYGDKEVSVMNFTYAEIDGKNTLVWSDGLNIYYIKDGEVAVALENGATISSQINSVTDNTGTYLFWTTNEGEASEIYYCKYKDGKWSESIKFTSRNNKFSNIAITSVNDRILGLASETMVTFDEETQEYIEGKANLTTFSANDYCDISVSAVEIDDTLLEIGDAVSVSFVVSNNGNTIVEDLIVNLTDSNGISKSFLVEADILPGKSDLYYIPYMISENFAGSTVTVEAVAENDVDLTNNKASYIADIAKVVITENSVVEYEDCYVIEALVLNESVVLAESIVVKSKFSDNENVEENGAVSVGNLVCGENALVQFIFEKEDLEYNEYGTANVYLSVEADNSNCQILPILLKDDDAVCGHPLTEEREAIFATCTEKGKKPGVYCKVCEACLSGGEEIPAIGHTPITGLSFDKEIIVLTKGKSFNLVPKTIPEEINACCLRWGSKWYVSDDSCIAIDDDGTVTANKIGAAIVTIETFDDISASYTVQVVPFDGAEYTGFDARLINSNTEVDIMGYFGTDTDITIPSTIGGLPVTTITSLGDKSVECISLPGGILSISSTAFSNSTSLKSITVDSQNKSFSSVDGVLYNYYKTQLVKYPSAKNDVEFTIPETVNKICANAFEGCTSLERIVIPYQVTSIDSTAFSGCNNTVIHCYNNSAAFDFAEINAIPYQLIKLDATGIDVENVYDAMYVGVEYQFSATLSPKYTDETVIWESADPNIVYITQDGKVTPNQLGKTIITATSSRGSVSKSYEVEVIGTVDDNYDEVNLVTLPKTEYFVGESIIPDIHPYGADNNSWVGLYVADDPEDDSVGSLSWIYTCDVDTNTDFVKGDYPQNPYNNNAPELNYNRVDFNSLYVNGAFAPGEYKLVFFADDGYTPIDRCYFTIVGNTSNRRMSTDKTVYKVGESIRVTATGTGTAWVGLYKRGEIPAQTTSYYWYYVQGLTGSVNTVSGMTYVMQDMYDNQRIPYGTELPAGAYSLHYFEDEYSYTIKETINFAIVEDDTPTEETCSHEEFDWITDKQPTCKEEGTKHSYCLACNETLSTESIDKLSHAGGTANCTDKAVCTACGEEYGEIDTENHKNIVTDEAVDSTCENNGLTEGSHCEACGEVIVEQIATEKLKHTGGTANCTDKAVCTACGKEYGELNAENHKNIEIDEAVDSTCEKNGLTEGLHCDACGEVIVEQIATEKLPHTYNSVVSPPTCTSIGFTTNTCVDCGYSYVSDEVPSNGHTESDWITDKASTCIAEGSKHTECTECGEVIKTEAIAKLSHEYISVVTKANCENGGYTTYTCSNCSDSYVSDKTPAIGHNYVDGVCTACGESKIDNCSHMCHKSGFIGFIWKIVRFFWKLFGMNPVCSCGATHY